ncbi:PTS transporter subunit EIIC [Calidifontibacter sp. DB0510]|uniref:PTS transporter subunit EIIC n=1 Tax=Metallococcus carri TaxID=1656884 RepID=A0A967EA86_9MICO|nr:PTS transporter subunit EIIC [Metallococcus carri]NHN55624.1 PTS transporter subunit EIIC [Metallococcus carri]NOP38192.1 PTS transporter subunit EIIC [Calidifontibacter sp. DB2511S]
MSTSAAAAAAPKQRRGMASLQKFGRSLMLPIAALPVAGLLLRLGADDVLGKDGLGWTKVAPVIAAGGGALFDNLPLLFAGGVAIGMAKKADGSTALAAVVGYLVFKNVGNAMSPLVLGTKPDPTGKPPMIDYGVLGGVLSGLIAAKLWERFHRTKLPPYLAFFGGRRLVPILTAFATLLLSVVTAFCYKAFAAGLQALSTWVSHNDVVGGFIYGTANRLLIPTGLHHILNSVPWFQLGSYQGAGGKTVQGDIARFAAHDPSAGSFMTGFFPIMMFALPAAALAIWQEARPDQKKVVGGLMGSAALCSFLTGVTEPLEFAFMFVAWPLYVIHAVLTGTSIALCNALGIRDGFNFSAGLFDYVLNFGIATKPLWLIVIGLGYAVLYYVVFRFAIRKWNLRTPGREAEGEDTLAPDTTP